jgi:hypothetical protein
MRVTPVWQTIFTVSSALKTAQNQFSAVASNLTEGMTGSEHQFPAFDDLPKVEGEPQGCIWGLFDTNGKKDEIGSMYFPLQPLHRSSVIN